MTSEAGNMGLHYLDRNQRIGSVLFGTVSENTTSEVGVTAWQWWTAVSGVDYKDGLIFTDWKKPGDPESISKGSLPPISPSAWIKWWGVARWVMCAIS